MSYYENRIKHLEGLVATMAREQRMKAISVEAKLVERIAEYQAENTRLKAEVDALKLGSLLTAVDVLQFINLKAENERLRKAGDALYESKIGYYGEQILEDMKHNSGELCRNWNAAKEGKPSV